MSVIDVESAIISFLPSFISSLIFIKIGPAPFIIVFKSIVPTSSFCFSFSCERRSVGIWDSNIGECGSIAISVLPIGTPFKRW